MCADGELVGVSGAWWGRVGAFVKVPQRLVLFLLSCKALGDSSLPAFEPSPGITHDHLVIQPHFSFLGFPNFKIVSLEVNLLSGGERLSQGKRSHEVCACSLEGSEKDSFLETRILGVIFGCSDHACMNLCAC